MRMLYWLIPPALAALARMASAEDWKLPDNAPLLTRWSKQVGPHNALPEYPRPQMARERWQNLNGLWDYVLTSKPEDKIPAAYTGKILVPYPIESALSGVMKPVLPKDRLWYHRLVTVPEAWRGQRVLLHFGAVDWETTVYLNGRELGGHRGGYDSFTFDITGALRSGETQELVVAVLDPTDTTWHLHGKQTLHPAGCSYTATSGIWQTVWMEPVPLTTSIETLYALPDLEQGVLKLTVIGRVGNEPLVLAARVLDGDKEVSSAGCQAGFELWPALRENKVSFYKNTGSWFTTDILVPMKNAKLWSPQSPFLYDLVIVLRDKHGKALDSIKSYFGMRSLGKQPDPKGFTRFLLNGEPTLMAGALDQGFWPDGVYTAATDEALKNDVEIAKRAGLNIIRKHVKVEPDRFYYWCDKLGLMVLQDMPTGNEGDPKTDLPTSPEASAQCELEKRALIQQRWNHPSIIAWCPFNEGWGQHDTLRYAAWIKQLDPSRLVDEASGFPWHGGGDIQDSHGGVSAPNPRQIGIVSENGGYGVATPGHDWPCEIWTYHSYDAETGRTMDAMEKGIKGDKLPKLDEKSKAWFTREVARLYSDLWAQKDARGMTGQFFCQLYDTESECDGLVSYDRAVWKVDTDLVSKAARGELTPAELKALR
ncbi:MAG: glycoside hydrolase family 2 protein [Limisphaerales bacterium]